MTATQCSWVRKFELSEELLNKHLILKFRVQNFNAGLNMRGSHTSNCYLVLDDVTLVRDYHYPCAVYAREGGEPLGKITSNFKEERLQRFKRHDSHKDPICQKFCMDFKCRFNDQVESLRVFSVK